MRRSQEYKKLADISFSMDNDEWYHKTDHLRENEVIKLGTHATLSVNQDIIRGKSVLKIPANIKQ